MTQNTAIQRKNYTLSCDKKGLLHQWISSKGLGARCGEGMREAKKKNYIYIYIYIYLTGLQVLENS